jgi:hypothetical protein
MKIYSPKSHVTLFPLPNFNRLYNNYGLGVCTNHHILRTHGPLVRDNHNLEGYKNMNPSHLHNLRTNKVTFHLKGV